MNKKVKFMVVVIMFIGMIAGLYSVASANNEPPPDNGEITHGETCERWWAYATHETYGTLSYHYPNQPWVNVGDSQTEQHWGDNESVIVRLYVEGQLLSQVKFERPECEPTPTPPPPTITPTPPPTNTPPPPTPEPRTPKYYTGFDCYEYWLMTEPGTDTTGWTFGHRRDVEGDIEPFNADGGDSSILSWVDGQGQAFFYARYQDGEWQQIAKIVRPDCTDPTPPPPPPVDDTMYWCTRFNADMSNTSAPEAGTLEMHDVMRGGTVFTQHFQAGWQDSGDWLCSESTNGIATWVYVTWTPDTGGSPVILGIVNHVPDDVPGWNNQFIGWLMPYDTMEAAMQNPHAIEIDFSNFD